MPKQKTIKLYYLGGLGENPDPRFRTPLNVSGSEFTLPPVHGYIEVSARVATRIMSKWQVSNKQGTFPAFTTDSRIMRQIRDGQRTIAGDMNIPPKKRFTVDELQKMLKAAQLDESELKAYEAQLDEPESKADESQAEAEAEAPKAEAEAQIDAPELKVDETDVPLPIVVDDPLPTEQEKPTKTSKSIKAGRKPAKGNKLNG